MITSLSTSRPVISRSTHTIASSFFMLALLQKVELCQQVCGGRVGGRGTQANRRMGAEAT